MKNKKFSAKLKWGILINEINNNLATNSKMGVFE